MKYINNGHPATTWCGITAAHFLRRCSQATEAEARAMSLVAGLMHAAEPITWDEYCAAWCALVAAERRIASCADKEG